MKEGICLVLITKNEADYLRPLVGHWNIHKTYSHHPKYYLTESPKAINLLNDYRNTHTSKVVEEKDFKLKNN